MIERLRRPGGRLGTWSVVCATGLALVGAVLAVALLVRLVAGGDFWSDNDADVVYGLLFAAAGVLGAVGFLWQDRMPWPGAVVAGIGGIAIALSLFWALVPVILGVAAVVVAVMRAQALTRSSAA